MSSARLHLGDLVIGHRFRGPPASGNGGYTCGRMAEYVGGNATVRLLSPPPLDIHLDVVRDGEQFQLRQGEDVIALAWPSSTDQTLDIPRAPDIEAARLQRKAFAGHTRHEFPTCFVCGVDRGDGDGLLIHAGPEHVVPGDVPGDVRGTAPQKAHRVACNWTPHASLCGEDGTLPVHMIWAALDCPGGWSFLSFGEDVALLGEMSARIEGTVRCGQEYIVAGWEIDREGRKRRTGSAIYSASGKPLAAALATWITIQPTRDG